MTWYFLCKKDELPINSSKGFDIELDQKRLELFVLTQHDKITAYKNHCPHLGIQLNWQPDVFLSPDESTIQCSTHGALFTLEEGHCIAGPCSGQSLTPLVLEQRNNEIWLQY